MAKLVNNLKVFGATDDVAQYLDAGSTHAGFIAGNVINAKDVNTALRNASIFTYSFLQMLQTWSTEQSSDTNDLTINTNSNIDNTFATKFTAIINDFINKRNVDTASKLNTVRTFTITDGTNTSTAVSSDLSSGVTINLPTTVTFNNVGTAGTTSYVGNSMTLSGSSGELQAVTVYATSDKKLKKNIKEYKPTKSILDLSIKEVDYKSNNKHTIGCLAQDLQEICPEIVHKNKDGYLMIEESKIVYLLLDEVKKLRKEVDALKGAK